MARIAEKILKDLVITYQGTVNLKELVAVMRRWCARYDYDIEEKLHASKPGEAVRSTTIKWVCDRKPDDYHKYYVKVKTEMLNYKEAVVDGEKVAEGTLTVTVNAELEHDYEGRWERPSQRFLRAVWDRFLLDEKEAQMIRRLKEDAKSLLEEVKRYLNVR